MILYFSFFLISIILSIFTFNIEKPFDKKSKKQIFFAILSAIPLISLIAFRYGVGNDYFSYVEYFNNSLHIHYLEFGFDLIVTMIRQFTSNSMWMFLVFSIIFIYVIYKSIYEQSYNPTLSILIFLCSPYYFEFFSGMRQMISVSLFLLSIKYIKNRKILPFLIINIIGFLFHTSSIVFLPAFFLYNKKMNFKTAIISFIVILLFRSYLAEFINNVVLMTDYSKYFDSSFDNGHFGIVTLIVPLFIYMFSMFFYTNGDKNYRFYCNLMFIQVIIVLFQDLIPLITRIGWGFGITQVILIPYSFQYIKSQKNRVYIFVFISLLYFIYLYNMRFSGGGSLIPYKWIFDYI